jgi:ABC-type taurine transport system ATPase subunit
MLTRLRVRNFKRFEEIDVELGDPVVFIGPNNSGKTSALQALALWEVGLRRWNEKRVAGTPQKRPGVTLNRRDLIAVPVPDSNLLWRDLHVRDVRRVGDKPKTTNVRVDISVDGVTLGRSWTCGLEFDYANPESLYCRPLRLSDEDKPPRMDVPPEAAAVRVAFLPPMSGLASNETRLDLGAINVRIGEGRTAEVLRNLCYLVTEQHWPKLQERVAVLFGVTLEPPEYVAERGEVVMTYQEQGQRLDLSSSGRGLQQTLLLLAYLYANPGAVLLLDEPDAHLEILRQRQIYRVLTEVAEANGNQVIAASHSEVLLNEAAQRNVVVAFIGRKPHRVNDRRGSQLLKSLNEIGFEDYYLAEQNGWVLYLEGSTDLAILQAFSGRLGHERATKALERPFVKYFANSTTEVSRHFHGLREAYPDLRGVALFDRLDRPLRDLGASGLMWRKREIENYLCTRETLESYATASEDITASPGPMFPRAAGAMRQAIDEVSRAMSTLGKGDPWSPDTKVSDDFLAPLFDRFYSLLELPNLMAKKNFHELARFVPVELIDPEVTEKLDAIVKVAESA